MNNDSLHGFLIFLNRAPGTWWLTGDSLLRWVTQRKLKEPIHIAMTCDFSHFEAYRMERKLGVKYKVKFDSKLDKNVVPNKREMEKFTNREYLTDVGLWRQRIDETQPYMVQLPFRYGEYLDSTILFWWLGTDKSTKIPVTKQVWFTPERKKNAYELIRLMYECADRAGMRDALYINFGTLLGYVKFGDIIPYDNDLDMGIMASRTTPENIRKFIEEIKRPFQIGKQKFPHGLGENMFRFSNNIPGLGYPSWLSVGHRSIMNDNGVKSCIWIMFEHSNHVFHSKGDHWVSKAKFPGFQIEKTDAALALGQPAYTLQDFTEIDFHGVKVNAPVNAGSCCSWWYDDFAAFGEGSSRHKVILAIKDWNNKRSWRMST